MRGVCFLSDLLRGFGATVLTALLIAAPWATTTWPATAARLDSPTPSAASRDSTGIPIDRSMFGVNVGTWDQQLADPSSVTTLKALGVGFEQFPNAPIYNWQTNEAPDASGRWFPEPVSLDQWGAILTATGEHGLYIVPYGSNPTGTSGESIADVTALTRYILTHHIPVSAMVIGSEQYLAGTPNLHRDKSPQRYAELAVEMAQAIHTLAPHMAVGVDLDVPENPSQPDTQDLTWNRIVLSRTAPYVQFVSAHIYPLPVVQSNVDLLQGLDTFISADMAFIRQQLAAYAGPAAGRLQVWITEFNPYNGVSAQSLDPVFGVALTESLLLWADLGAKQVDWWSLHGDAKAPIPPNRPVSATSLVTDPQAPFGTFGLASEGIPPQPEPINTLYPAGTALARLMRLIGTGARLSFDQSLYATDHLLAFAVTQGGRRTWILINARHIAQTVILGDRTVVMAPAGMAIDRSSSAAPVVLDAPPLASSIPIISSAVYAAGSGTLTITGAGFGNISPALEPAPSGGVDQSRLEVLDTTTGASYGWTQPGQTDWYGVQVREWSPTKIRLSFPVAAPSATDRLVARFWQATAGEYLLTAQAAATTSWLGSAAAPPTVTAIRWSGARDLVVSGANFGPPPPTVPAESGGTDQAVLRIADRTTGANYGWAAHGQADWYGVQIEGWTPTQIVIRFTVTPPHPGDALSLEFPGLVTSTWSTVVPAPS